MRASMSRSVLVFPRSPFLLFLRFKRGGSRERCCALKAWQLLRLAALSGQVPKPAGARRSRREDLKAKARPGDNGCLPYAAALFRPPPVSIRLFVSRSVKAKHRACLIQGGAPQTDAMRRSPHHLISGRIESVPKSLMHIARAERGLQGGMGSILVTGVFSHGPSRSHVPPWNWNPVSVPFVSFRRSSFRLQNGAFWDQAVLEIAPERDQCVRRRR